MRVAIYGQPYHGEVHQPVTELLEELHAIGADIAVEETFAQVLGMNPDYPRFVQDHGLDATFDLFVSFGGDGTILRAITYIGDLGIPIVGVNTGRLGFLSTIRKEQVRTLVREFAAGRYTLVERSLVAAHLEGEVPGGKNLNFALNEVTVSRKDTTSMITVET